MLSFLLERRDPRIDPLKHLAGARIRVVMYAWLDQRGPKPISGALSPFRPPMLAHPLLGPDDHHATFEQQLRFWSIVGGATVLSAAASAALVYIARSASLALLA